MKRIRENAEKDAEVNDLDIKIALLVKNRITIEDFVKSTAKANASKKDNTSQASLDEGVLALNSLKSLDKANVERLKRYQELFYLLQTQPRYLSRLFFYMNRNKVKGFFDSIVFSIFGYAQNSRDEYMLLKLIDATLAEELSRISDFEEFLKGNPITVQLAVVYTRYVLFMFMLIFIFM